MGIVGAPARSASIAPQTTCVVISGGDLREGAWRGRCLTGIIYAPANRAPVLLEPATEEGPGGYVGHYRLAESDFGVPASGTAGWIAR